MSLLRLPACQVDELFACLGPEYSSLRATSVYARDRSNHVDLSLEILRWHCVNSYFLSEKLHCLESLGQIPLRCTFCATRSRTRQRYRYTRARRPDGRREGVSYLCCVCALQETRLFLTDPGDTLVAQGSNGRARERADLLLGILCRIALPRGGFAAECVSALRRQ